MKKKYLHNYLGFKNSRLNIANGDIEIRIRGKWYILGSRNIRMNSLEFIN